jgi:hypothetical protein
MPDTTWPVHGYPPGSSRRLFISPVSMPSTCFDTSTAVRSRSPSWSPPDASSAPFPRSLTTTVFSQRSTRRFDASPRRATPKGHNPFITCTAPHQEDLPTSNPSPRSRRTKEQAKPCSSVSWVAGSADKRARFPAPHWNASAADRPRYGCGTKAPTEAFGRGLSTGGRGNRTPDLVLAGQVAASVARNVVSTVLVFAVAFLIGFRPSAGPLRWLAAIGILLLFVVAISALFATIGLVARAPRRPTASPSSSLSCRTPAVPSYRCTRCPRGCTGSPTTNRSRRSPRAFAVSCSTHRSAATRGVPWCGAPACCWYPRSPQPYSSAAAPGELSPLLRRGDHGSRKSLGTAGGGPWSSIENRWITVFDLPLAAPMVTPPLIPPLAARVPSSDQA